MATSGTYMTEISLKGSAENHYKRGKSENHLFPDTISHHIQNVTVHEGDHDSHGSIRTWNYTWDGKQEVLKEKRELDDENLTLTLRGLEGHLMKQLKMYDIILQYIPKPEDDGCVCKITMLWEKRNDDSPEPSDHMKFLKSIVATTRKHQF